MRKPSGKSRGSGSGANSGSSSTVTVGEPGGGDGQCQESHQQWVEAEFNRLSSVYSAVAAVDAVEGELGPLLYANVEVAGTPVNALVDPGSTATIMSFKLFRTISTKVGIPRSALQRPDVTLRDYSKRAIPIFAKVDMEISLQGKRITVLVYLRSDQGPKGEPCLFGTGAIGADGS